MTLEEAENRRRQLASTVKRLRAAAMSAPERGEELADALVELTAAHLLAWDVTEAAATAPEAAVLAARILASRGPAGPYASLPDAVRYFSATTHLAAVQAGLGQADAAGRTLDGLDAWRPQVDRLPLAENLPDQVAIWNLLARARSALGTDVALANALADAAEIRLHTTTPPPYLALAVHLATADARWAGGRPESALAHHRLALDAHRQATADRAAARRPAVARTTLAPVAAVYEAYAHRLTATGDADGGRALRRAEMALLASFPGVEAPAPARALQPGAPAGARVDWEPLPPVLALGPGPGRAAEAVALWQRAEQDALFAGAAARAEAERSEAALRAQAEAAARQREQERARAERAAAEAAAAAAARQRETLRLEAERAAARAEADAAAARAAAEERRLALAREHRRTVDPEEARAAAQELDLARAAARDADGDAASAAAHDRLAGVLRPLAAVEPAYRTELADTLEVLVGLLWRLGDPDGSRAAAREAKTLNS